MAATPNEFGELVVRELGGCECEPRIVVLLGVLWSISYQKFHNQDEKVGLVIMKLSACLGSMTLTSSRDFCL